MLNGLMNVASIRRFITNRKRAKKSNFL